MSYTTPQLDAAEAVAEMLTGRSIAGFTLEARSDQLLPVYSLEKGELRQLRVDCLPVATYRIERQDRMTLIQECPVNIVVQLACGREDQPLYRQLLALLNGIALVVMSVPLERFGSPIEIDEVEERPDELLLDGRFEGIVPVSYRDFVEVTV